tara:strand:+ start:275 stop:739 length:465 start_codon:yes stop_codon:yes gene_type:complete
MRDNTREGKCHLHHIINVGDAFNFRKSKFPFWGVSQKNRKYIDTSIYIGDVVWFCQDIGDKFKVIRMCEYTHAFDSIDEPLIQLNIIEREIQNWDENVVNDIQIHFKELYDTEKQEIFINPCESEISTYSSTEHSENLFKHYDGFKKYAEPINK